MRNSAELRAGELVEVRTKEEILETLDKNGQLEGLPFMPEMLELCGKRFRVFKRAHKTCDPPNLGGRRMLGAIHLEDVRCNGVAHGGCQARCLVFWKEAWLKRVDGDPNPGMRTSRHEPSHRTGTGSLAGCTEQDVVAGTRKRTEQASSDEPTFICQATQVEQATQPWQWWDPRQYVEDYTSGNTRLSRLLASFLFLFYEQLVAAGLGLGAALRWIYDVFQSARGAPPYPWRLGKIPLGVKTPTTILGVQPGEFVKIRSYGEILETLDEKGLNRGMSFDAEMVPYCGKTFRVLDRISTIINEKTGKMQHLKNECIMLDKVVCLACYAKYRLACPRSIYPYWREIWLERVGPNGSGVGKNK
jgi:hypothetical protein